MPVPSQDVNVEDFFSSVCSSAQAEPMVETELNRFRLAGLLVLPNDTGTALAPPCGAPYAAANTGPRADTKQTEYRRA